MSYRESQNEILDLIHASYPFLHIVTEDDVPVVHTFKRIAEEIIPEKNYDVITWNISSGFFCEHGEFDKKGFLTKEKSTEERVRELYKFIKEYKKNAIFVLQDFDYIFKEFKTLSYGMKEVVQSIASPLEKSKGLKRHILTSNVERKHVVITSSTQHIPRELDKMVNLVYFGMPGKKEIGEIIDIVAERTGESLTEGKRGNLIRACFGLTEPEIANALFKSISSSDDGKLSVREISMHKEQIVRKGGLVEFITPKVGLNDVGGLRNLLDWVKKRQVAFDEDKRLKRKLPYPKGILMTGVQGCGKSHSVKAIASYLEVPLVRLDIGTLMGKYVGESEANVRKAINLAESMAPCVLWIDEIEKGLPDPRSANTHEVSKRILQYFLTWLQEKESAVFVVATANNIDSLPPELMRKGRFNEIFFVDLPTSEEIKQIMNIHLSKYDVNLNDFDFDVLAKEFDGFSGAEIEDVISEANFQSAFDDEPLSEKYILEEIERTTPISVIRSDKIRDIREWAKKNKVRPAN